MGNTSARVRDKLWDKAVEKLKDGSVVQIWSENCPQGYRWRSCGNSQRQFVDMEGIALIKIVQRKSLGISVNEDETDVDTVGSS